MIIGIPKELKDQESRVAAVPGAVADLVKNGIEVLVESGAGEGSGISDADYAESGAKVFDSAAEVWEKSDIIYKVKEPLKEEYQYLREGLIVYCYLHLAGNEELLDQLLEKKVTAIGFETVVKDGKP